MTRDCLFVSRRRFTCASRSALAPRSRSRNGATFDLLIEGEGIACLLQEAGGHRWQRIPPTERRGRVHTSTVTVAVFECPPESTWQIDERDIEVFTTKDTGPGGRHRNKTESCVVASQAYGGRGEGQRAKPTPEQEDRSGHARSSGSRADG